MKTTIKRFVITITVSAAVSLLSSCATMFAEKTTPVVLINAPGDLKVSENGSELTITEVKAHVKGNLDESTTTYYAAGVELDKKIKRHSLTLTSSGKSQTLEVKLRAGGKWIILDMFSGGLLGWGIDAGTKKWRVAAHKYIDVPATLEGKKPMSQGKLKRTLKKQAKN